jgi:hypothetical protein
MHPGLWHWMPAFSWGLETFPPVLCMFCPLGPLQRPQQPYCAKVTCCDSRVCSPAWKQPPQCSASRSACHMLTVTSALRVAQAVMCVVPGLATDLADAKTDVDFRTLCAVTVWCLQDGHS